MDLSITATLTLVGMAFLAGLVSSIAGSGGLLTLPVLLWAGLPPISALATNKLQSAVATLISVTNFRRHGYLQIAPLVPSLMAAFLVLPRARYCLFCWSFYSATTWLARPLRASYSS